MDFLLFIMYSLIGYYLFNSFSNYQMRKLDKLIEQKVIESIPTLYTEVAGNILYLYEKETNNFQCQAMSIEELAKALLDVRAIEIAKVVHDNKEIWFVTGDVLDEIDLEIKIKE